MAVEAGSLAVRGLTGAAASPARVCGGHVGVAAVVINGFASGEGGSRGGER